MALSTTRATASVSCPWWTCTGKAIPRKCCWTIFPRYAWPSSKLKQKTPRKIPCPASGGLPTIATSALLNLAMWIRQRRQDTQGGEACPTTKTALLPPVPECDRNKSAADGPLGEDSERGTAARSPRVRKHPAAKAPHTSRKQGGDA